MQYVYSVVRFYGNHEPDADTHGPSGLCGLFASYKEAEDAVLASTPHEVWEYAFGTICIEMLYFGALGPLAAMGNAIREEIRWFRWECDEPFEEKQSGRYVACECPKWAKSTFGFV